MSIFDSLLGPAPPVELLRLAREVGELAAEFTTTPQGSPDYFRRAGKLYERRTMLARSAPATDLDMLALAFTARQAIYVLQTVDLSVLDEARRDYWTSEAADALSGIQNLLERRLSMTMEEMGFGFLSGRRMN